MKPFNFLLKRVVKLIHLSFENFGFFLAFLACLPFGALERTLALDTFLKEVVEGIEAPFPESYVSLF